MTPLLFLGRGSYCFFILKQGKDVFLMEDYYLLLKYKNKEAVPLKHNFFKTVDLQTKKAKLKELRQSYINKELDVFCSCQKSKIRMSLAYRKDTDTYYLSSFNGEAHLHQVDCYFSSSNGASFSSKSNYQSGYTEKDGIIEVNLDSQAYLNSNNIISPVSQKVTSSAKSKAPSSSTSQAKPSIYALTKRLVTEAWNDSIKFAGNKNYPTNDKAVIFNQLRNHTLKKYSVNGCSLFKIFYPGKTPGMVYRIEQANKTAAFTILMLADQIEDADDEYFVMHVKSPIEKESQKVLVKKTLYDNALQNIRSIRGPYFVGGFLTNTGFGTPPKFLSFCLVPISEYGTPIESSFERQLYNLLAEEKRKVIRPGVNSLKPEWNGFIPDGLFTDTKPHTILEVFGMSENAIDYHEERLLKIKCFSNLKPKYSFWYWDAYNNISVPLLPQRK